MSKKVFLTMISGPPSALGWLSPVSSSPSSAAVGTSGRGLSRSRASWQLVEAGKELLGRTSMVTAKALPIPPAALAKSQAASRKTHNSSCAKSCHTGNFNSCLRTPAPTQILNCKLGFPSWQVSSQITSTKPFHPTSSNVRPAWQSSGDERNRNLNNTLLPKLPKETSNGGESSILSVLSRNAPGATVQWTCMQPEPISKYCCNSSDDGGGVTWDGASGGGGGGCTGGSKKPAGASWGAPVGVNVC
mmetsp:Transcript_78385/g.196834  ORF Transcript_78385/g.196834 Transcript_78385/m.196834 type:complete len:246 (-) Transcript_78385:658-1395(-)